MQREDSGSGRRSRLLPEIQCRLEVRASERLHDSQAHLPYTTAKPSSIMSTFAVFSPAGFSPLTASLPPRLCSLAQSFLTDAHHQRRRGALYSTCRGICGSQRGQPLWCTAPPRGCCARRRIGGRTFLLRIVGCPTWRYLGEPLRLSSFSRSRPNASQRNLFLESVILSSIASSSRNAFRRFAAAIVCGDCPDEAAGEPSTLEATPPVRSASSRPVGSSYELPFCQGQAKGHCSFVRILPPSTLVSRCPICVPLAQPDRRSHCGYPPGSRTPRPSASQTRQCKPCVLRPTRKS
ncbi:hypothetical protein BD413DRAFT_78401 [Trametes elegans]|nr:hypothetical protein BD413DRAFT_78401 [Trametes elegans]